MANYTSKLAIFSKKVILKAKSFNQPQNKHAVIFLAAFLVAISAYTAVVLSTLGKDFPLWPIGIAFIFGNLGVGFVSHWKSIVQWWGSAGHPWGSSIIFSLAGVLWATTLFQMPLYMSACQQMSAAEAEYRSVQESAGISPERLLAWPEIRFVGSTMRENPLCVRATSIIEAYGNTVLATDRTAEGYLLTQLLYDRLFSRQCVDTETYQAISSALYTHAVARRIVAERVLNALSKVPGFSWIDAPNADLLSRMRLSQRHFCRSSNTSFGKDLDSTISLQEKCLALDDSRVATLQELSSARSGVPEMEIPSVTK